MSWLPNPEYADWWYNFSWKGIIWFGGIAAFATAATVLFTVIQFWSDGVRDENAERRSISMELALKEADARAKEAELALVKFRQPRLPNSEQLKLIAEKLRPFAGTFFDVGLSASSGEQADFIWRLEEALANFSSNVPNAGWVEIDWGARDGFTVIKRGSRPISGSVAAQNVEIHLHPEYREALLPAARALISALNEIGIAARDAGFNAHSTNANAIHLLIGEKR